MPRSVFDQNNDAGSQDQQTQQKTADELFEELVGEGKKYSTPAELAKAYFHANSHIDRLEKENDDYRVKVEASSRVEDILARLKPAADSQDKTPDVTHQERSGEQQPDIDSLVQKALEAKLAERDHSANVDKVAQALKAKFGDQAQSKFDAKAKELGLDLNTLSAQSPAAVLALFGAEAGPKGGLPVGGDTSQSASGNVPQHGTRAYAEYMYDTKQITRDQKYAMLHEFAANPALYNSQRTYKK